MAETIEYVISLIIILAGSVIFLYGFNRMHKYRLIQDTPRSKIRSMAMGIVEVHGNAEADRYIKTPFSQTDCVYYRYKIEEYRKHTQTDSKGNQRTSYSWETVSTGERRIPFFAKDDTGKVQVEPDGAEYNVSVKKVFLQKAGLFGAIGTIVNILKDWDSNKQPDINVSAWGLLPIDTKSHISFGNSVGDRKYYEYFIEPGEQLFVLGTAANKPQTSDVLIRKGENEPTFLISDKSEKDLMGSLKWKLVGSFVFGAVLIIAGVIMLLQFTGNI